MTLTLQTLAAIASRRNNNLNHQHLNIIMRSRWKNFHSFRQLSILYYSPTNSVVGKTKLKAPKLSIYSLI
ncbi:MAG: hypothetical protein WEC12_04485 [Balneolaceae bacterium]